MHSRITSKQANQEATMAKATTNNDNGKPISVKMALAKTTKGTYVYNSVDASAPVRSVYVNRDGMPDGAWQTIRLSVVEEK
jgi:hypothetical protein